MVVGDGWVMELDWNLDRIARRVRFSVVNAWNAAEESASGGEVELLFGGETAGEIGG